MDIRSYLRDLDREEEDIRAQIMRLQIRIQQLNDTRLVLMQREEERAMQTGHQSPFGAVDGHIIVRDRARMMPKEEEATSLPPPAPKPKHLPNVPQTDYEPPPGTERLGLPAVVALLQAEGPMSRPEINRRLKVTGGDEAAKLTKTLSNMRQHGYIRRDSEQRFVALKASKGQGGKGNSRKMAKPDPERAEAERQLILDVLANQPEPLPSGDVLTLALGKDRKNKNKRDRLYWALKSLRDKGAVTFRDGLYRIADRAA